MHVSLNNCVLVMTWVGFFFWVEAYEHWSIDHIQLVIDIRKENQGLTEANYVLKTLNEFISAGSESGH